MASKYGDLDRPPLDPGPLRRALVTPGSLWTAVDVVPECPSTNAELAAVAAEPGAVGRVLVAEHQPAGRGRLGRVWTSPPRAGLTLSALVRPDGVDDAQWSWLPLLAGLAVAAALQQVAEVDARLKWPNDVMIGERKVAGLLVERVAAPGGPVAVIGIGLNVTLGTDELPVPTATSLGLAGAATTDRSVLARAILRNLDGLVRHWQREGDATTSGLRSAYEGACSTLGRPVRVDLPGRPPLEGVAEAIDDRGRLVVRGPDGPRPLEAGEVLHLRPQS